MSVVCDPRGLPFEELPLDMRNRFLSYASKEGYTLFVFVQPQDKNQKSLGVYIEGKKGGTKVNLGYEYMMGLI